MLRDLLTVVVIALIAQGAITTWLLITSLRRHRTRHVGWEGPYAPYLTALVPARPAIGRATVPAQVHRHRAIRGVTAQ